MKKIRNKSTDEQTFTNHPPFAAGEVRPVSDEDADFLSRSPHMEIVNEQSSHQIKGTSKDKSFRAVEKD